MVPRCNNQTRGGRAFTKSGGRILSCQKRWPPSARIFFDFKVSPILLDSALESEKRCNLAKWRCWLLVLAKRVPKIRFSGTRNQPKNGFKAIWTRLFFIFCHIFKVIQHLLCAPLWKIIKYGKNLAKNEEKPCSTLS